MIIKKQTLFMTALLIYLVPTILFLALWFKWQIAIILLFTMGYCLHNIQISVHIRQIEQNDTLLISFPKIVSLLLISTLIILFSGIGGFFPQSGDAVARNPVFFDLITHPWPVYFSQTNTALCYYFGFWLFPALVAKIFLCFGIEIAWSVGQFMLLLESILFYFVSMLLLVSFLFMRTKNISHRRKCKKQQNKDIEVGWQALLIPILFLLFAGLNELGVISFSYLNRAMLNEIPVHKDWYEGHMVYNGIFVAISYTFNSMLPSILAALLFLCCEQEGKPYYVILLCGLIINAPMPLIGFTAILVIHGIYQLYFCYRRNGSTASVGKFIVHEYLNPCNILCLIVSIFIATLYLNHSETKIIYDTFWLESFIHLARLVVSAICEFGIAAVILYQTQRKNVIYWASLIVLIFLNFWKLAHIYDWPLRVSTFPIIFFSVYMIQALRQMQNKKMHTAAVFAAVYLGITSLDVFGDMSLHITRGLNVGRMNLEVWTFKSLDNYRLDTRYYYVPQYIKPIPNNDLFFSRLSAIENMDAISPDVIVKNGQLHITCQSSDISYLKNYLYGDWSGLEKFTSQKLDRATFKVENNELHLNAQPHFLNKNQKHVNITAINPEILSDFSGAHTAFAPAFLELEVTNQSDEMIPAPDINSGIRSGIVWIFTSQSGDYASDYDNIQIEYNILPDQTTTLYLPICTASLEPGIYTLHAGFYQDENIFSTDELSVEFEIG